jgi:hypothetical protein
MAPHICPEMKLQIIGNTWTERTLIIKSSYEMSSRHYIQAYQAKRWDCTLQCGAASLGFLSSINRER